MDSDTAYCQRCCVYLEPSSSVCPLCQRSVIGATSTHGLPFSNGPLPYAQEMEQFWHSKKKLSLRSVFKSALMMLIFGLGSTLFILLAMLVMNINKPAMFSGLMYGVVSIIFTLGLVVLFYFVRLPIIFSSILAGWCITFFLMLDLLNGHLTWSLWRGIPIVIAFFLPFLVPMVYWRLARIKGLNVLASATAALAISFFFLDIATSSRSGFDLSGWSIIPIGISLAVVAGLFYLHHGSRWHIHLDEMFHMRRTAVNEQKDSTE